MNIFVIFQLFYSKTNEMWTLNTCDFGRVYYVSMISNFVLIIKMEQTVSVLQQNEGGTGKSIPDAWEISWDLRGLKIISRADGMDFPIPPEFWWSTDILLILNSFRGMDQEIHPSRQGRIGSVKIKSSLLLLRMREWRVLAAWPLPGICSRLVPNSESILLSDFRNCVCSSM